MRLVLDTNGLGVRPDRYASRASPRTPDPTDAFPPALSETGEADYLVTGDKSGLLALDRLKATRIVSTRDFVAVFA